MSYFLQKVRVEYPAHKVKLTRPFLMGTYEVTVDQWDAFVKDTGYKRLAERSRSGTATRDSAAAKRSPTAPHR